MKIRLDKALHDAGFGTRSSIKKMLHNKVCTVNEVRVFDGSYKIEESDVIAISGKVISLKKHIYLMLNKKAGYITSTKDPKDKTIMELLPDEWKNRGLFPVGRLDIDTEGLIILTNDGIFAHKVISPKYKIVKKYFVLLREEIKKEEFEDIKNLFFEGLLLKNGYKCLSATIEPAIIELDSKMFKSLNLSNIGKNTISKGYVVGISEGKYHQVKKMFLSVGNEVIYLKRIAIGNLLLDDNLKTGEIREMDEYEVLNVFN